MPNVIKDLDLLRPEFHARVDLFLRVLTSILGIDVRVHETLRLHAQQLADVASGASKNRIGKHEFGLAIDIGCYLDGVYQADDRSGLYLKCGFVGMAIGFRWGGNWDRDRNIAEPGESDFGHFEDPSHTIDELVAAEGMRV